LGLRPCVEGGENTRTAFGPQGYGFFFRGNFWGGVNALTAFRGCAPKGVHAELNLLLWNRVSEKVTDFENVCQTTQYSEKNLCCGGFFIIFSCNPDYYYYFLLQVGLSLGGTVSILPRDFQEFLLFLLSLINLTNQH